MEKSLNFIDKKLGFEGFRLILGRTPRAISENEDFSFYLSADTKERDSMGFYYSEVKDIEKGIFNKIWDDSELLLRFECNNLTIPLNKLEKLKKTFEANLTDIFKFESTTDKECGAGDWNWLIFKCSKNNLNDFLSNSSNLFQDIFE